MLNLLNNCSFASGSTVSDRNMIDEIIGIAESFILATFIEIARAGALFSLCDQIRVHLYEFSIVGDFVVGIYDPGSVAKNSGHGASARGKALLLSWDLAGLYMHERLEYASVGDT